MNWELLHNLGKTGYMQLLGSVEKKVFKRSEVYISRWSKEDGLNMKEMYGLYDEIDLYINEKYRELFGI
mgnify:CR=1 FL=1